MKLDYLRPRFAEHGWTVEERGKLAGDALARWRWLPIGQLGHDTPRLQEPVGHSVAAAELRLEVRAPRLVAEREMRAALVQLDDFRPTRLSPNDRLLRQ